ncbi:piercer of microtubule wall 1 protein isoform 1-T1 [Thomomys bottae]
MSGEHPQECQEVPPRGAELPVPGETQPREGEASPPPREDQAPERTSDYYRVSALLPGRFNHPACFQGYRSQDTTSLYRTSNQTYGSRAPTVHEMPPTPRALPDLRVGLPTLEPFLLKAYFPNSNKFSKHQSACGMFQRNAFNVSLDRSVVTGPDNFITAYDRLNFHPSYNTNRPSFCD